MNIQAGVYIAHGRAVASSVLSIMFAPLALCLAFTTLGLIGHISANTILAAVVVPYVIGGLFSLWRLAARNQFHDASPNLDATNAGLPGRREFYSFAWKASIVGIISLGLGYTDRFLLGAFASFSAVGLFSLPARTARMLNLPVYFLNPVAGPVYAAVNGRSGICNALGVFRASADFISSLVLPVGLTAIIYSGHLLNFIGGPQYSVAASTMSILVAGVLILTLSGNSGLLLQLAGRENAEVLCTTAGLAINLIVSIVLLRPLGIVGVAIGTTAGLIVVAVSRFVVCRVTWRLGFADLLGARQIFGASLLVLVAMTGRAISISWPVTACIALFVFAVLNPPWIAMRNLSQALANAEISPETPLGKIDNHV